MKSKNTNEDELSQSFKDTVKANGLNFLLIYIFIGAIPFVFSGFKFDQNNIGSTKLIFIAIALGLVLFFLYVSFIYLKNYILRKLKQQNG